MRAHAIVTTAGHRCGSEDSFHQANVERSAGLGIQHSTEARDLSLVARFGLQFGLAWFSRRIPSSIEPNSYSQLIRTLQKAGKNLLDLTISNPTQAFADYPHSSIHNAFSAVRDFTYKPHPFGSQLAREAVAGYYARRSLRIDPSRIVLSASTSEAYATLFKLLCNPDDEVLVPSPSYPLFEYLAAAECVKTVAYALRYDGAWYIDFQDLRGHISSATRAIVTVNPNNPTGTYLTCNELDQLVSIAREHQIPIISDEVFSDYAIELRRDTTRSLAGVQDILSFSLNGLSKVAGMPQLKLGWLVINGPEEERHSVRERLEIICDTYLSVGTPVQSALPLLLTSGEIFQRTIQERIKGNLHVLDHLLTGSVASRLQLDGGWSAILRLPDFFGEPDQPARLLEQEHIIVQSGYLFALPDSHVVISLLTNPEDFSRGVNSISRFSDRKLTRE